VKNVTRVTERCVLWLVPIFSLLPLLLATPDATAKASRQRDTIWRHPALDSLAPQTIAILPAVVFAENAHAMRLVEQRWRQLYSETGHCWLSANASRVRMAAQSPRGDSLYEVIARQVRSTGQVDSTMGRRLARLMGVESVLSLRIDRWEVADGGRAMIEVTAALVDSTGTLLWKISGAAGYGSPTYSGWMSADASDIIDARGTGPRFGPDRMDCSSRAIIDSRLLPQLAEENFEHALYKLLARWAVNVPKARRPSGELAAGTSAQQPDVR